MNDCGVELVGVREMEVEASVSMESFGTERALVKMLAGMKEDMELEVMVTRSGKGTVGTVDIRQEQRHALVGIGEKMLFDD